MNKKKLSLLFFSALLLAGFAQAQKTNITGDTIFVNTETEIQVKFPSDNIDMRWTDLNPPYAVSAGPSSIFLHAKSENAKCARLNVFEGQGPRNHSFIICYAKDINKDIYDFATVKKLQQRVKEIEDRDAAKKTSGNNPAPVVTSVAATDKPTSNPPVESKPARYLALLEEGDKAFKDGLLDEALSKFEEVLRLQPSNDYARKRLSDVNLKKADKERLAKKDIDDRFNVAKTNANRAFSSKKYDDAIKGYTEALALKPDDIFSKNQLALIQQSQLEAEENGKNEAKRLEKKEQEDKINSMRLKASKAFDEKRYDDAIAAYNEVLAINTEDRTSKNQIEAIQKIKVQSKLQEQQDKISKDQQTTFITTVTNADKAFADKDFEVAKAGYMTAKDLRPSDLSLDKKIKATNDKIADKAKEDEYNNAISAGDEAKKAKEYEKANLEYAKANKIFKDRAYPLQQVAEINKIIAGTKLAEKVESDKLLREQEKNNTYTSAIEKADKALEKNDFNSAKALYMQASNLKPEESYPKSKISEIAISVESMQKASKAKADSIARAAELNKKFNLAIEKGKAALDRKDLNTAKAAYLQAADLKPDEPEPKDKIELINKKIAGTDVDAKYNAALARGNTALADKNYAEALVNYKDAQKVKPLDTYVLSQVRSVQDMITRDSIQQVDKQRRADMLVQEEIRKKRFDEGMNAYANYETAAQTANFEEQLLNLKHFLNIIPDASELNSYQFNAGAKIDFAKKKIKAIRDYLSSKKGSAYQLEPIPYLNQEIEKKYENINFYAPPEDQLIVRLDSTAYNEKVKLGSDVLLEKPRLEIADSTESVKLICQGVSFKGDGVFFKFLIQNRGADEFLTGLIQMSLNKKKATPIKDKPNYISSFPIVLPGKDFFMIYSTADREVNDDDSLVFDLNDRLKKKKIHLSIPGKIYNQEKKLKS